MSPDVAVAVYATDIIQNFEKEIQKAYFHMVLDIFLISI
jgi:hypothetical protein